MTANSDLNVPFLSAAATASAIRAKQVSSVEAVQAYLERIDKLDPTLKAYITVCREEALEAAGRLDSDLAKGGTAGPLAGVPVAVKDQYQTAGILTTNGSKVYQDFVPTEDATVISRIKQAGGILLGKLNMSELAMGGTEKPPWGTPGNPWDLERTPGESSSGSGVALAAHLCAASMGEDTGGSGRGPASYCGVVGFKPTHGLIPRTGVLAQSSYLDTIGTYARTIEDAVKALGD